MGVLRNMWKIMKSQEWQGDPKQNGGVFILGPGMHFYLNGAKYFCFPIFK